MDQHLPEYYTREASTAAEANPPALPAPSRKPRTEQTKSGRVKFALGYAKYGIRVFPCHWIEGDGECSCGKLDCDSAGKHPYDKAWQEQATADPGEIRKLWRERPEANVGLLCGSDSNLTALDVDGDDGCGTLREWELEHGELPVTPLAHTGGGHGDHYLFSYQPGVLNAVRFAPGLDIRTQAGLLIGVGSANQRGAYVWDPSFTLGDSGLMPAKMPGWLVEKILAGQHRQQGDSGKPSAPDPATMVKGAGRNATLWRLGRSLKGQKFGRDAIRAALVESIVVRTAHPDVPAGGAR